MSENKVLAVVNNKEITDMSVMRFIKNLGPERGQQFNSEDGRKKVVEELIHQELLYADAIENHYDEDDEFLARLDATEEEMLKQYAVFKVIGDIYISDDEVEKYYKENKPNFFRDELLRASHILIDTQDKADEVLNNLNDGVDFAEVATKFSSCASKEKGGDLGFFAKGRMVKEFEDAAFSMELGEISKPVKTQFGYHIIKLTDRKEAGILPLDEIKENLRVDLLKAKQNYFYTKKLEELKHKYPVEMRESVQ